MELKGKKALITGGAMGLGLGVVETLADRGVKIVCFDVAEQAGQSNAERLNAKYGPGTVTFIKCDVTKPSELESCFQKAVQILGKIDIVHNNAGLVLENKWEYMMDVNVKGVIQGTNLAIAHMRKDKGGNGGVIINTSSYVGLIPRFVFPAYVASKHAVTGFTLAWACNPYLKEMGLRFGTLCPTAVDTAFQQFRDEQFLYPDEFKEMRKKISIMPVSDAVKGFMQILLDDSSNGSNMAITSNGPCYKQLVVQDGKGLPEYK